MNEKAITDAAFPPGIVTCVGAVVLRDHQVLFVRQSYGELQGQWSVPWGFVDGRAADGFPEPPDAAAVRETYEEAGIIVEVVGLLGIQSHQSTTGEARLYVLFLCRHLSGEPVPDGHETDASAYFSLAEITAMHEAVEPFCRWIAERVLRGQHSLIMPACGTPYSPHHAFL